MNRRTDVGQNIYYFILPLENGLKLSLMIEETCRLAGEMARLDWRDHDRLDYRRAARTSCSARSAMRSLEAP